MNFSQRLGLFILICISLAYVYFSFFNENIESTNTNKEISEYNPLEKTSETESNKFSSNNQEKKNIKIFLIDDTGKIQSVNRICNMETEQSCFSFAIKELINAPTKWEKSKGLTSEIPVGTKILSIRESNNSILIDLSSNFESGGGAESTYTRVKQIIKTANANTSVPTYLYINGKQANVIGGEGIMIKQPLTERSFDE